MSNNNDQGWDVPEGIPYDECRKYYGCEKHQSECSFFKEITGQVADKSSNIEQPGVGKASNMNVANSINSAVDTSIITGDTSNLTEEEKIAYNTQVEQLQQLSVCVEKMFGNEEEAKTADSEGGNFQRAAFLLSALWGTSDTVKISFTKNIPPTYPGEQPQWDGSKLKPQTNVMVSEQGQGSCSVVTDCIQQVGVGFTCINGTCQKNIMPLWYTKEQCMSGLMPDREESKLTSEEENFEAEVRKMDPMEAIKKIVKDKIQPLIGITLDFVEDGGDIRIQLDKTKGSWSIVGQQCKSAQPEEATMNFGWLDVSTVIHEFCHALGMIHEHQNPFGKGIDWNVKKVFAWARTTQGWDFYSTCSNIVKKYSTDTVNGSAFDPYSIMLYSYPAWLTNNNMGTYRNIKLSKLDELWLSCMYPKGGGARVCPSSGSALFSSQMTSFLKPSNILFWGSVIIIVGILSYMIYKKYYGK